MMTNSFPISSSVDRSAIGHYREGEKARRAFVLRAGVLGVTVS